MKRLSKEIKIFNPDVFALMQAIIAAQNVIEEEEEEEWSEELEECRRYKERIKCEKDVETK